VDLERVREFVRRLEAKQEEGDKERSDNEEQDDPR